MNHILPGDKYDGKTVIASVIYTDEPDVGDEPLWTLILLNESSPHFSVVVCSGEDPDVYYNNVGDFFNIVFAVEEYQSWGGDV